MEPKTLVVMPHVRTVALVNLALQANDIDVCVLLVSLVNVVKMMLTSAGRKLTSVTKTPNARTTKDPTLALAKQVILEMDSSAKISMSALIILTTAAKIMPCVTTPKDPSAAHVSQGIPEMAITAQW